MRCRLLMSKTQSTERLPEDRAFVHRWLRLGPLRGRQA
jgi:hypothetical protein